MSESYPAPDDHSSPTLPDLPDQSPVRLQFGIKTLLTLMLGSAVLAAALHYGLVYFGGLDQNLPAYHQPILVSEAIMVSLLLSAWVYFLIRMPYFSRDMGRFWKRWKAIRAHRGALAAWSQQQRELRHSESAVGDGDREGPNRV